MKFVYGHEGQGHLCTNCIQFISVYLMSCWLWNKYRWQLYCVSVEYWFEKNESLSLEIYTITTISEVKPDYKSILLILKVFFFFLNIFRHFNVALTIKQTNQSSHISKIDVKSIIY